MTEDEGAADDRGGWVVTVAEIAMDDDGKGLRRDIMSGGSTPPSLGGLGLLRHNCCWCCSSSSSGLSAAASTPPFPERMRNSNDDEGESSRPRNNPSTPRVVIALWSSDNVLRQVSWRSASPRSTANRSLNKFRDTFKT